MSIQCSDLNDLFLALFEKFTNKQTDPDMFKDYTIDNLKDLQEEHGIFNVKNVDDFIESLKFLCDEIEPHTEDLTKLAAKLHKIRTETNNDLDERDNILNVLFRFVFKMRDLYVDIYDNIGLEIFEIRLNGTFCQNFAEWVDEVMKNLDRFYVFEWDREEQNIEKIELKKIGVYDLIKLDDLIKEALKELEKLEIKILESENLTLEKFILLHGFCNPNTLNDLAHTLEEGEDESETKFENCLYVCTGIAAAVFSFIETTGEKVPEQFWKVLKMILTILKTLNKNPNAYTFADTFEAGYLIRNLKNLNN